MKYRVITLCMSLDPASFIIPLGRRLYRIPEVAPPLDISLIFVKKCSKFISHTGKFLFFVIYDHNKQMTTTFMAYTQSLSLQ
jgi:hypothetical protein